MTRRSLRFDPGIEQRKYLVSEGCVLVLPRTSGAPENTPAEEKQAFSTVALSFASICDLGG